MVMEGGQTEPSTAVGNPQVSVEHPQVSVENPQVSVEEKEKQRNSPTEEGGECPESESKPAAKSGEDEPRRKPLHSEVVDMAMSEEQLPYFFPAHPISYFSNDNENSLESNNNEDISVPPLLPPSSPQHSPTLLPTLSSTAASLIHDILQQPMPRLPPAPQPKVYDVRLSVCVCRS